MLDMTMTELDALESVAKSATPGPWRQGHHVGEPRALCACSNPRDSLLALDRDGMAIVGSEVDARFIAAANPAAILDLVKELRRLLHAESVWKHR